MKKIYIISKFNFDYVKFFDEKAFLISIYKFSKDSKKIYFQLIEDNIIYIHSKYVSTNSPYNMYLFSTKSLKYTTSIIYM